MIDRINQIKEKEKFSVLIRAKLRKEKYHTIVRIFIYLIGFVR